MGGADKETRSDSSRNDVFVGEQTARPESRVGRVLSRIASVPTTDPGPPPDGGYSGWMAEHEPTCRLADSMLTSSTYRGFINSFGVFQTYYVELLQRPPADVSWIGSFQVFLLFFIGAFSGRLTDAGYFRPLFLCGSFFILLGIFATSWCTQYWQIFLAHGVCVGLGNGLTFCPTLAVLSTYFDKRRALAIGIAAVGSASGGLVFPSTVRQMLPQAGFPWAMRTLGFIQLATLTIGFIFLKPRIPPRKKSQMVDLSAFKELEYSFYAAGGFFSFMGVYFAFYYAASFSRDELGFSYPNSLNLLLILNGVGFIGRLGPNWLADKVGTITVFTPMAFLSGILTYCWIAVRSPVGLYVWACIFGVVGNAVQALFPAGVSALTTDPSKQGTRIGMIFTIVSFAVLSGPPIAGAIITATGGRYYGAQAFAGSCLMIGTFFLSFARIVKTKKKGEGWFAKV
ncbi:major facilitator superfamily transporter [Colletotrichum musicola]|uniref:Major facilitator superfamily transporter n=1 Tax=Colletotrichum musicola TaxID=2175873 RepID=A0A8H6KB02_9PEZI|nr:major facilitator superfamily transporter [Colletotrichum musicola]